MMHGRTPRWVRGLKYGYMYLALYDFYGRTPRWVRGLKFSDYLILFNRTRVAPSHPTMGAWIEIERYC